MWNRTFLCGEVDFRAHIFKSIFWCIVSLCHKCTPLSVDLDPGSFGGSGSGSGTSIPETSTPGTSTPFSRCFDGSISVRDFIATERSVIGLLQVCVDGQYGGICASGWDDRDAAVACTQSRFPTSRELSAK